MYRIMLVDDEPLILAGITSMLNWEEEGYQIVGKAYNGQKALEAMEELKPDIVVADIKMPAMDGLTLMQKAKEAGYPSVFILLTNLEEFSFAKEAVRLGAADYLVKLELSEESLLEALERAAAKCERLKQQEEAASWSGADEPSLTEKIRDYFKTVLVYDTRAELEPRYMEAISAKYKKPALLLINFNYGYAGFSEAFTREDQKKSMGFAENIISEMVRGFFQENCLLRREQNSFMVVVSAEGIADYEAQVRLMAGKLQSVMHDYFEVSVTIAASRLGNEIAEMSELLYQAMSAMNYSYYEGNGAIVFYSEECEQNDKHSANFDIHFLKKDLMFAVRQNDGEKFADIMEQMIALFVEYKPAKIQAVNACNNLYSFVTTLLEEREETSFSYAVNIVGQLNRMENLDMVLQWLRGFTDEVVRVLDECRGCKVDRNVELAKHFVEEHMKEKVTLNRVAAELGVSVGHLSSSFKRQTGQNFSDYATDIKIERAKELIKSGKYMIYEIADMLGYETPFYFSRVFKKVVGVSPREYELTNSVK